MPDAKDIFISYARSDGRDIARRLRDELSAHGFDIWQDVVSMEGGEDWRKQIDKAIESVRTMVLILTPGSLASKYVRAEWVHARRVGTHILPVTYDSAVLEGAPRWMQRVHIFNLSPDDLSIAESYANFLNQLRKPPLRAPVPVMALRPPNEFAARPQHQTDMTARLLSDERADPRPGRVALLGGGGFGKTTLAQAVCHDPEIIEAFTGGVLWATPGEDGQYIGSALNAMLKALGAGEQNTPEQAARLLHEKLAERECLIVLDDVWERAHADLFLGAARCTYLITTRLDEVAALADDEHKRLVIGDMLPDEAVELLVNHLPEKQRPPRDKRERLYTLAARLGEWALLLDIFGGTLRTEMIAGSSLDAALTYLEDGLDEEGLTVFDRSEAGRNHALAASMSASLRRYRDDEKRRLFELAIFRDDANVPEDVAKRLWARTGGMSGFAAGKLLRRFAGQFFQRSVIADAPIIRFHDRVREYLLGQLGADAARETHNTLLDAYNPDGKRWCDALDTERDGYLFDSLVYHLRGAGRDTALPDLFADDGWMRARVEASGYVYSGFINDVMTAWRDVAHPGAADDPLLLAACVRYALIRATIISLAANYVPELVARAVETGLWTAKRSLSIAENVPDAKQNAKLYTLLLATGKLSDEERREAEELGLAAALALEDEGYRARALAGLGGQLRGALLERALEAALALEHKQAGAVALGSQLSGTLLERGLEAALALKNEEYRARALAGLAGQLSGEPRELALEQALAAALSIRDDQYRAAALAGLAGQLSEVLLGEAVMEAWAIRDEGSRTLVLAALGRHMSGALLERALEAALALKNEEYRARAGGAGAADERGTAGTGIRGGADAGG
jgi:hypothetical protein